MKILLSIFSLFFTSFVFPPSSICDCAKPNLSSKYQRSSSVFLARIKEPLADKVYLRKWSLEVLQEFKGKALDTLLGGGICGVNFHEGDTVLIYGHKFGNGIATNMCSGNQRLNFRKSQAYCLAQLELEALEWYHKIGNEKTFDDRPRFKEYLAGFPENPFRSGFIDLHAKLDKVAIVAVEFLLKKNGSIADLDFLNPSSKQSQIAITKLLKNKSWKFPAKKTAEEENYRMIKTFLYFENKVYSF